MKTYPQITIALAALMLSLATPDAFSQLVFTFSDSGNGTTQITLSGSGTIDNDSSTQSTFLGFNPTLPPQFDADMLASPVPAGLNGSSAASLDETLIDTISINISGFGDITFDEFFSNGNFGFRDSTSGGFDPVTGAARTISGVDTSGIIGVSYSTFAILHGQSFATTDGWTFTFEDALPPATDPNAARKASLKKKIRKLKRKLRIAKRKKQKAKIRSLSRKVRKLSRNLRRL